MQDIIPKSEIEAYKNQVDVAETYSTGLVIKGEGDYVSATIEAKAIKERVELITGRKEEITKPLNQSLKLIRELFKPMEDRGNGALNIIKAKMLAYTTAKEKKIDDDKAKIDARVEKGTISESTAEVKKFMLDTKVTKTVSTELGSATTSKVKKYYVVDKSKIPLQFLEPDMTKIKASFKAGTPVDGVEERLESQLSFK